MNLLLLSNSTNFGSSYLEHCASHIDEFLGDQREVLLIPYAAVNYSFEEYESMAQNAMSVFGITVKSIHHFEDPIEAIQNAKAVAVAGGNTFRLLQQLYDLNIIDVLRSRVESGVPYIGWSAGSNVAGQTICTTNDMPIVQPRSFDSFGFVKAQLNPHYTDRLIEEHQGETRSQRITEYTQLNPESIVIALPEGSWIQFKQNKWNYHSDEKMVVFKKGEPIRYLNSAEASEWLNDSLFTR